MGLSIDTAVFFCYNDTERNLAAILPWRKERMDMNWKQLPLYEGKHGDILYTDTYNECTLMTVKETSKEAFDAYLAALTDAGYTEKSPLRRVLGTENQAAIYANGEDLVNLFYDASRNEVKITVEPLQGLDLSVFDPAAATDGAAQSLLFQLGLAGLPQGDAMAQEEKAWWIGMSYVYRLSDGRFVIWDGGLFDRTRNHPARLYKVMKDHCVSPDGKITVAAWFFTHPHTDHMGAFVDFVKLYWQDPKYNVAIERVICNLCNVDTQTTPAPEGYERSVTAEKVEGYNRVLQTLRAGGVQVYKAHAGQMYYLGNLTVEVLFTFDILTPDMLAPNILPVHFSVEEGSEEDLQYQAYDAYVAEHGKESVSRAENGDGTVTYTYGDTAVTVELNKARDHYMRTWGETDHGRSRAKNPALENTVTYLAYAKNDYTNVVSVVTQATVHVDGAEHRALFTGDATWEALEWMNAAYGKAMKSDFVQPPHHGCGHFPRVKLGEIGEVSEELLAAHAPYARIALNFKKDKECWFTYRHPAQLDLFYGERKNRAQLRAELEQTGRTALYEEYYPEEGEYGNVRAKYVLWPTSVVGGTVYYQWYHVKEEGPTRECLLPEVHFAEEVGRENVLAAGHTVTKIAFDGADVRIEKEIPYGDLSAYNAYPEE